MTASEPPKLAAILLAAGGSSRLGRPKQLLKLNGEILLRRAARLLADSDYFPVVVVLGHRAESLAAELAGLPVHTTENKEWAEGMSSSIKKGLEKLVDLEPDVDGVLITLCDQPRITKEMLNRFAKEYSRTAAPVIAAAYSGTSGVPALFSRGIFEELRKLDGDRGARRIIHNRPDTMMLDLPEASVDLDSEADLALFGITNSE